MDTSINLSERLVERRLLSSEELDRVVKMQIEQHSPLTRLVVELGFLSEEDLLPVLRDHFDIPLMSLRDVPNAALPLELPPGIGDFFKLARIVPVMIEGTELVVATTDPLDISAAKQHLGWEPQYSVRKAFEDYLVEIKAARA